MTNTHFIKLSRTIAAAALVIAPSLHAQESRLFTWRGVVDDDLRIAMRAGNIQSQIVAGDANSTGGRVNRANVLPRRDGMVRVELLEGRGTVHVLQQPSSSNGYTALFQVKDAQGGAGAYRFAAYFEPTVTVGRRGGRRVFESGGEVLGGLSRGEPVMRWSGNVDGEVRIVLRRNEAGYTVLSGNALRSVRAQIAPGGLPRAESRLALSGRQGRGSIFIDQNPSAQNGYTAIIRIFDGDPGYGFYDFDIIWR
jgi:hypothetical protein